MGNEEELEILGDEEEEDELTQPLDYGKMLTYESPREASVDAVAPQSLTEAEEETVNKTDLKAILDVLTPKFPDKELNEVLQPAMVSRIPSDNLLDKMKLLVLRELWRREPTENIDIIAVISWVHDALFIGWEGRGIGDRLELAGVMHEEELEKMSKELGFGA